MLMPTKVDNDYFIRNRAIHKMYSLSIFIEYQQFTCKGVTEYEFIKSM